MTENSDSEEEILVYAEFKDNVNIDKHKNLHILGIDSKTPVFQLDDSFYQGTFENPMGTYMFFDEDPSPHSLDPLFDKLPDKNLKYLFKTRKFLSLQHSFITPKEAQEKQIEQTVPDDHDNTVPIKFQSVPEAEQVFRKEWAIKEEIKK